MNGSRFLSFFFWTLATAFALAAGWFGVLETTKSQESEDSAKVRAEGFLRALPGLRLLEVPFAIVEIVKAAESAFQGAVARLATRSDLSSIRFWCAAAIVIVTILTSTLWYAGTVLTLFLALCLASVPRKTLERREELSWFTSIFYWVLLRTERLMAQLIVGFSMLTALPVSSMPFPFGPIRSFWFTGNNQFLILGLTIISVCLSVGLYGTNPYVGNPEIPVKVSPSFVAIQVMTILAGSLIWTTICGLVGLHWYSDNAFESNYVLYIANAFCDIVTVYTSLRILRALDEHRSGRMLILATLLELMLASILAILSMSMAFASPDMQPGLTKGFQVFVARMPGGKGLYFGPYFWIAHSTFLPLAVAFVVSLILFFLRLALLDPSVYLLRRASSEASYLKMSKEVCALYAGAFGALGGLVSLAAGH